MKEQTPAYLDALTFPRFILAMLVVIVHFGLHLNVFKDSILSGLFNHGAVAVSFFFFLSGFVLAYNYGRNTSTKTFLFKRLFRLYPTYILTFLIVLIAVFIMEGNAPTMIYGILNMLGLQSWFPGYVLQVNFPSWSISVEFFFYACFPFILKLFYRLRLKFFLLISLFIIILGGIEHYLAISEYYDPERYYLKQFILYFPPFHISTFIAGFLCGKLIHYLRSLSFSSWLYTGMAIAGFALFILILNTDNFYRPYNHNGGLIPVFAMICIGLAMDTKFFKTLFGWTPLQFLGEISYGIYMWQLPVFLVFKYSLLTSELTMSMFILYIFCLIGWSAVMYKFFEKPLRRWLSKKFIYS